MGLQVCPTPTTPTPWRPTPYCITWTNPSQIISMCRDSDGHHTHTHAHVVWGFDDGCIYEPIYDWKTYYSNRTCQKYMCLARLWKKPWLYALLLLSTNFFDRKTNAGVGWIPPAFIENFIHPLNKWLTHYILGHTIPKSAFWQAAEVN